MVQINGPFVNGFQAYCSSTAYRELLDFGREGKVAFPKVNRATHTWGIRRTVVGGDSKVPVLHQGAQTILTIAVLHQGCKASFSSKFGAIW